MKVAILSDIHGNLEALQAVLKDLKIHNNINALILLGDLIDYGPHSNEVISTLENIDIPIVCNIWGNHEKSILDKDYERFSSERGKESAKYTGESLCAESYDYIRERMNCSGILEFELDSRKCLAVHGSLEDNFWKSIFPNVDVDTYKEFDYVFSGHSHEPHFFEKYSKIENAESRNRKKTIFINPGSVGQPRNINSYSQYAILESEMECIQLIKVRYDIQKEVECFTNNVDPFYKERLLKGV